MFTAEEIKKKVYDSRDIALEFLAECLRTPSVTGNEQQMGNVVSKWINDFGLEAKTYCKAEGRPNIVAEWKGNQEGKRVVFNGHLDVFPPVEGKPGKFGPWSGKIEDGYIYGRGAVDMKSGLCASIMAVRFLKEMGFEPKGSVLLTCVSDEENGGEYGAKYLLSQGLIEGDMGLCMEPTKQKVLLEHCGGLELRITYSSQSGHTSMPHPSTDALNKSIDAIIALRELSKKVQKNYNEEMKCHSLLSVTMIESGNAYNMYPSKSSFVIDRRLLPGEKMDEVKKEIFDVLDEIKESNAEYAYEYEILCEYPALLVDKDEEIVKISMEAYKEITGKETCTNKRGGGSDASDIVESAGFPMPNFGPSTDATSEYGASTHEDERILIDDYITFIAVYMSVLVKSLS